MHRLTRAVIITGMALLVILTTCSPLWQLRAQAGDTAISAWRPPAAPLLHPGRLPTARVATRAAPPGLPTAQPTVAPPPTATIVSEQLGRMINTYLSALVDAGLFQGAVLVARNGQIILSQGYGMADAARGVANTARTRFRLASVSKQFTATAIMILQARGKLGVHDSICVYLEGCPDAWRPISIQHLLTHTSGLPNYTDFASYEQTQAQPTTPDELVARFRDLPLLFTPGTAYMYENSDYVLLGMIIERASGQPYADFLHDAIFAPLGMRDSGVAGAEGGAAVGYRVVGEPAPALDPSTLFAAGALYSTVEDMYRWDQALYTTRLLPRALLDAMWTPYTRGYGYGWRVTSFAGHRQMSHPGLIDGFATSIARYPDDRVTIVVLSNMSGGDVDGISNYITSLLFGG